MKRLILELNRKGGVGKSFIAVNVVQYLKDRGAAHAAIDTDNENSTLKRFHPDADFVDIENARELDSILERLVKHALEVVDARAATIDLRLSYFAEIKLPEVLKELRARLTLIVPINHEADSVDRVQRLVAALGHLPAYEIVRNAVDSDSFAVVRLADRKLLLGELGAREIDLPRLQHWIVRE